MLKFQAITLLSLLSSLSLLASCRHDRPHKAHIMSESHKSSGQIKGHLCFPRAHFEENFQKDFLSVYVINNPFIYENSSVKKIDTTALTIELFNGKKTKKFRYKTIDDSTTLCFKNNSVVMFFNP